MRFNSLFYQHENDSDIGNVARTKPKLSRRSPRKRRFEAPTFFDRLEQWPKCQKCRKRYSPVIPVKTEGGVFVPRCYCNNCGTRLDPLIDEHFQKANDNNGLIRTALRIHRKDLYFRFENDPTFVKEMQDWAVVPLALIARRYDPKKLVNGRPVAFSTYAVASLRNLINKEFPFVMPLGQGGDSDGVFENVNSRHIGYESENPESSWRKRLVERPKRNFEYAAFHSNDFASYGAAGRDL